jgi:two-component system, cell cycle sensor histidine kinase and response regulator CckA
MSRLGPAVQGAVGMAATETDGELEREVLRLRARVSELESHALVSARVDARYQLLLEHLNVGVFVSSLEGRMIECNDRVLQMSGEPSREALFNRDLAGTYERPEDRERLVYELRTKGCIRNFQTWTRQANGKRTFASMNAVLAPLGPGGSPLILGMLEDITDLKLAEERAGEGEERFRVLAEQSLLGIAILQDDAIRFVNQAVSEMNGYSIEEMSSWRVADFAQVIHPEDLGFATEQARKKQAGELNALAHYEYRLITKSGELRWAEQFSRTIEYGGRPADFVTIIDITARKQVEASLTQLATSMERASKLEALGVLAAGIAHDFNNLLGGLYGHLDLARASLAPGSAGRAHLDLAHQAFDRATALTGQLLAFAKGSAPVRKVGSLASCVRQCAEFALSGSNVKVELELDDALWNAEFDGNQLAQAFDNLLINAKQAMPSGGLLRIVGKNVDAVESPGVGLALGQYVKLSFIDRGCGIAPAIVGRIFDPFFTTKAQGSGLGLTAAYAIMKKHQGQLEVESSEGEGSTFNVWLPAVNAQPASSKPPKQPTKTGQGLVLVMDDDDMVRRVAGSMLSHLGYEPLPTADGAEALEKVRSVLAEGKLLTAAVLDLTVRSGAGGRDIVGPLRELLPSLPIVASSGYSDDPIMAEPKEFGFSASLRKPFLLNDLGLLLSQLIEDAKR